TSWSVTQPAATLAQLAQCTSATRMKKAGIGFSFDDFLKEEGTYEVTEAIAIKRRQTIRRLPSGGRRRSIALQLVAETARVGRGSARPGARRPVGTLRRFPRLA